MRHRGRPARTATTGATTRTTGWRPRGPTPPASRPRTAARGSPSSGPWSAACTVTACGWSWTRCSTTRRPPARRTTSVLDRIVPGYYQRLDAAGAVQTSTCCQNVATEHAMGQKIMVDSVVSWARNYHVDGFRFDLMGHHSKANMLAVRAALDRLTPARDGVDGRSIYLYGEGWNFGEVADNALFTQATQGNLGGTGIGTFSDRLRDAVRGGGPFDEDPRKQGFGSGESTDPNGAAVNDGAARLAGPRHRPGPARAGRQPQGVHLQGQQRQDGAGRPGRLQRRSRRLRRPAGRGHQLRRRPRQRDHLGLADVQAAGVDVDGRPGADEHHVAGHHRAGPDAVVLARGGGPAAQQEPGPQQLRLR